MGGGRGGWYSWDWLDNDGQPSATCLVSEWQDLHEGGFRLTPAPGGRTRLVTRTRSRGPRLMRLLVGEPVHFVMQPDSCTSCAS